MGEDAVPTQHDTLILVGGSGPLAGVRYALGQAVTRIGRAPENNIVIRGPEAAVVSARHAEIWRDGDALRIHDLDSTNGTFVNGERVAEAELSPPCTIVLGSGGPEFRLTTGDVDSPAENGMDRTLEATPGAADQSLIAQAVSRVRSARRLGLSNQTTVILRQAVRAAVHRSSRKLKIAVAALAALLVAVASYAGWRIHELRQAKAAIDAQIQQLEARLAQAGADPGAVGSLVDDLERYQGLGRTLERSPLYRLGARTPEDPIRGEIKMLLAEFGAEVYRVPPEFAEQVQRFIERYQGPDRPHMARALGEARPVIDRLRRGLERNSLPPDLAYMVLVESALDGSQKSGAGSAGVWQFTAATARAYGLRVDGGVDERMQVDKATQAASKYIRELILDFGAGSSVMLALAAYNVGPTRVKNAIRDKVKDPIRQRSFWYLYKIRALPVETREYVPKVFAAMLIGRNPERFGF